LDSAEAGPVLLEREKYDDGQKFMFDTQMFQAPKKFATGARADAVDKKVGSEEAVGLMDHPHVLLFVFLIGVVTGLRSLTGPAVTSWAARLGWLTLIGTPMHFMASMITVTIFTLLAVVELVADQLPSTPARTAPVGLSARVVMGGLCGATVGVAGGESIALGIVVGILGAIVGTYGGYYARTRSVKALGVPDVVIAVIEDIVAVGGGLLVLSRF
jgi:uncharacterized membrane protein